MSIPTQRTVRFGVIGCGLMGREFATAAARWAHLASFHVRPEIVAVCNRSERPLEWFRQRVPTVRQVTHDYHALIQNSEVEAVYIAVPHHLHQEIYVAALQAGKHLMGEKPFGIDLDANQRISHTLAQHPTVFARCSSHWAYFPGAQRIAQWLEQQRFGQIIEAHAGFLHSSDLDPNKPINWKRKVEFNGQYGCMGDLGMHVLHIPFRAGWVPRNVRAILANLVTERPDAHGQLVPCSTWDNATLLCETLNPQDGRTFPFTIRTHRIAPGERNTWFLEIYGTRASARFNLRNPKRVELLQYQPGGEQVWVQHQTGYESLYPTITGANFEFGFGDAFLQMWAAFLDELDRGQTPSHFAGCVTPSEVALSHRLFTAALHSHYTKQVVELPSTPAMPFAPAANRS